MKRLSTADPCFDRQLAALLADRSEQTGGVAAAVTKIVDRVRRDGDAALIALTGEHDRWVPSPATLRISGAQIEAASASIEPELAAALDLAAERIEAFHRAQLPLDLELRDPIGVGMGLRWTAVDRVGIYVPGGTAAYPSSVLMNAIPARIAGVGRIAMCVPCPDGRTPPLVLAAARRAGVDEIYRVGGAQAIAALAFGTASVPQVDRIVGPGNAWVAEAKRQVYGRVGIDGINGPSEVLIIADAGADPAAVAIDLLAQAEHDAAAQAILVTDSEALARAVEAGIEAALMTLERTEIARAAIAAHGAIVVVRDLDEAVEVSDRVAPEHLQILTAAPEAVFARIRHAGSVFLGADTPEAVGDYVGGPNHVLPTGGTARFASGLSVFDFLKRTTWLAAGPGALQAIGPAAVRLARAEGLTAHAASVALRLGVATPSA